MTFSHTLLFAFTLAAALGSGLIAGTFFAFSNFVMAALGRLHIPAGISAMQSINVVVLNPIFLGIFMGTGVVSLVLLVYAVLHWSHPSAGWWVAGAALYLLGNIVVTMACNVPRNDALAAVDAARPESAELWRDYVITWTRWNHVRTITALAASAAFIIALLSLQAASKTPATALLNQIE